MLCHYFTDIRNMGTCFSLGGRGLEMYVHWRLFVLLSCFTSEYQIGGL